MRPSSFRSSSFLVRSVLFAPTDRYKVLEKAVQVLRPDVIVLDLEDSVSPEKKALGRLNVIKLLEEHSAASIPSKLALRMNCPLSTSWATEDLRLVNEIHRRLHCLIIPKVDSRVSLEVTSDALMGVYNKTLPFWPMIETARGVQNVEAIADSREVEALVFGREDLSKSLRLPQSSDRKDALLYCMSKVILAARASEKLAIDGVFMNISDERGLSMDSHYGRGLGFDGKSLIHPSQVELVNSIYTPSGGEISAAKEVIEAWEEAVSEGKSVAVLNGKLIEHLHYKQARDTLERIESIMSLSREIGDREN